MINQVHNINFLDNQLPDKCAQLIIADPPYFEVKGDFDFIWKTFDDYLVDVKKWAIECKRILADNGTLFWYGHSKKIAYSQVIIDNYFEIIFFWFIKARPYAFTCITSPKTVKLKSKMSIGDNIMNKKWVSASNIITAVMVVLLALKSLLWKRQKTDHYLSQGSLSPY